MQVRKHYFKRKHVERIGQAKNLDVLGAELVRIK